MNTTTTYSVKAKRLKHIELGKTLINKELYHDAFDHFKKSIAINPDVAIDILTYLYKEECHKKDPVDIQLITAKIYIEINVYHEAFEAFKEILDDTPNHEPTYEALGKLMVKKALRGKIKQCFENAIRHGVYFPVIINALPKLYLEEKNYTQAINLYNKLIEIQPNEYSHYKILSELHFRKRDYESASQILQELINVAPFKSEELLQPIEQILQKIPRHPVIRTLYANVLFRAFKPIEGCKEIETLIKYNPNKKADAIKCLKEQNQAFPQTPDILYLLSELMIESELYTESLQHIQVMIDLSPIHCDKCLLLMQKIIQYYPKHGLALEIIGNIYFQQQNSLQAFYYYNQCIEETATTSELGFIENIKSIATKNEDTAQPMAKLLLAKIYEKSNQIDAALQLINDLDGTSEEIDATLLKIHILNQHQQSIQALPIIDTLLSKHPFHWNIHQMMQTTLHTHTQHQIQQLNQETNTPETYLNLSSQWLSKAEPKAATQELQKIDQKSNEYETAQRMIARCFFEQSRFDLSDQIYSRIIKHTNNTTTIKECHYWKGLSHLLLSNDKDALQSFETIATYDQSYLHTSPIINQLRKNKFLNHNGFVLVGCQTFLNHPKNLRLALRKNQQTTQKKKRHEFEVIGFAQSYNDEGCKQILKQQYKAGEESFKLAIQMDPKFHIAYINLALLNTIENNTADALEHISQAEAMTSSCPYLFYIKGLCFIQKNDVESAIRCIQQAIKLLPSEGLFYITIGDLFYHQHQIELAATYWEKSKNTIEYFHWIQQRHRAKHFDKISIDYWLSPEFLSLR